MPDVFSPASIMTAPCDLVRHAGPRPGMHRCSPSLALTRRATRAVSRRSSFPLGWSGPATDTIRHVLVRGLEPPAGVALLRSPCVVLMSLASDLGVMVWIVEALLLLLLVLATLWGRSVISQKRDRRDRAQVLRSLEGRRVTVLAGFDNVLAHTGVLGVANEGAGPDARPGEASIVLRDGENQRWFILGEVHSVTDAGSGVRLGGPW